jgi:hypothetical protein
VDAPQFTPSRILEKKNRSDEEEPCQSCFAISPLVRTRARARTFGCGLRRELSRTLRRAKSFASPRSADFALRWSGWWDSNPRPPRPERGALAKLSHSPIRLRARRLYPVPAQINRRFCGSPQAFLEEPRYCPRLALQYSTRPFITPVTYSSKIFWCITPPKFRTPLYSPA